MCLCLLYESTSVASPGCMPVSGGLLIQQDFQLGNVSWPAFGTCKADLLTCGCTLTMWL